ncbi:MAG: hypothetical protein SYC29_17000 [Planctomycetota bacterium]|nr:hypothetical protein [Planctomycetota bacterium]
MDSLLVRDGPAAGGDAAGRARTPIADPIDDNRHVRLWERVLCRTRAPLLQEAADIDPQDVNAIERLRAQWPKSLVAAALDLVAARRKAAQKFPHVEEIVSDVVGIEQATSHQVAEHKARRFAAVISEGRCGGRIVDLCCGIGGDAMSLMRIAEVTALDINPLRAWMARRNAACCAQAADVETMSLEGELFHLDPARRTARGAIDDQRRIWKYEDYRPGPAFINRLLTTCPDGAIKLGPGVDLDALPLATSGGGGREIEIINEGGTLVQAVLWCGALALHPGKRTATRLPDGLSFTAAPQAAPVMEGRAREAFHRFLYVPDPAIERAGLLGALCADLPVREVHPGLGILTSDQRLENPWLSAYEVLTQLPWRPRKIADWLSAHNGGIVEVKTRGKAVDTDLVQHDLRGDGDEKYTIFALRLGRKLMAAITRPVRD